MKLLKCIILFISLWKIAISQQTQGIKLFDVSVDGNILASENTIIFTSGLRKGLTVSASEFQRAIKRLWNLGLFQDMITNMGNFLIMLI